MIWWREILSSSDIDREEVQLDEVKAFRWEHKKRSDWKSQVMRILPAEYNKINYFICNGQWPMSNKQYVGNFKSLFTINISCILQNSTEAKNKAVS